MNINLLDELSMFHVERIISTRKDEFNKKLNLQDICLSTTSQVDDTFYE